MSSCGEGGGCPALSMASIASSSAGNPGILAFETARTSSRESDRGSAMIRTPRGFKYAVATSLKLSNSGPVSSSRCGI